MLLNCQFCNLYFVQDCPLCAISSFFVLRSNIGILFLYEFKLGRNIRSAFEEDSILEMGGSLWWNFKNSGNENLENETRGNIKQG